MYESKGRQPVSNKEFYKRITRNIFLAFIILIFSLAIGILGYHFFNDLSWIDSFYNACMILTGMGPVNALRSDGAKIFGSFYALYSGVAFLTTIAVVLVPVLHRLMHKFHFNTKE